MMHSYSTIKQRVPKNPYLKWVDYLSLSSKVNQNAIKAKKHAVNEAKQSLG